MGKKGQLAGLLRAARPRSVGQRALANQRHCTRTSSTVQRTSRNSKRDRNSTFVITTTSPPLKNSYDVPYHTLRDFVLSFIAWSQVGYTVLRATLRPEALPYRMCALFTAVRCFMENVVKRPTISYSTFFTGTANPIRAGGAAPGGATGQGRRRKVCGTRWYVSCMRRIFVALIYPYRLQYRQL